MGQSLMGEGCGMQMRKFGYEKNPHGTSSERLGENMSTPNPKTQGEASLWYRACKSQSKLVTNSLPPVYSAELITTLELSNKTLPKVVAFKLSKIFDLQFIVRNTFHVSCKLK